MTRRHENGGILVEHSNFLVSCEILLKSGAVIHIPWTLGSKIGYNDILFKKKKTKNQKKKKTTHQKT